jgi:cytochrome bd-type quinol oxidase subunit 2
MVSVSHKEVLRMKKTVLLIVLAIAIAFAMWLLMTPEPVFTQESRASYWVYMSIGLIMMVIPIVWIINMKDKKNTPDDKN